jgi:hypothetical protein
VNAEQKAELDRQIQASGGLGATAKDQFLPVLEAEYAKVEWPKKYTMTTDALWQKLGGDQNATALTQSDASSMVTIWNICAWSLQLVDDTKAGRSTKAAETGLAELNKSEMRDAVKPILEDARLGGLSTANQFIEANDCKKGFA